MAWNRDMSEAPHGKYEVRARKTKSGTADKKVFVPAYVIAAGTGTFVTGSFYLPDEKRWEFFTKDVPPIAWKPWPTHPSLEGGAS